MAKETTELDEPQRRLVDAIADSHAQSALEEVIAAANDDSEVDAWRISIYDLPGPNPQGLKEPWIRDCDIGELADIRHILKAERGPGKYRVRVRYKRKAFRVFDIEIAYPRGAVIPVSGASSTSSPANGTSELATVLAALQRQNQEFLAGIVQVLKPEPRAGFADQVKEFGAMVAAVKELMPPPPPPPATSIADTFKLAFDLAREVGGGGNETNWLDLLRDGLNSPTVQQLVQNLGQAPAAPAPPRSIAPPPRPPAPRPQAPAPIAPAPAPAATSSALPPELTRALDYLTTQAQAGAQPELWADWTLSQLTEPALDMLDSFADPVDDLAKMHNGVAGNRAWFDALISAVWNVLDELDAQSTGAHSPVDRDSATGRTGGNARSAQAHAQAGAIRQTESG